MEWRAAFEESAGRTLALYQTPGMAVAVARDGQAVYQHGFGHRDRERGLPVGPATVFGIGSITKSFTCVAIMQLQERGRLSVHDPVQKHLPEFSTPDPAAARAMTLHHFMTHSSGLPPLPSLYPAMARSIAGDPASPPQLAGGEARPIDTTADLIDAIAHGDFELLGPPGAQFSYSNDAYALLGAVVERASGQPYGDYLREHILGPCGMTSTTLSAAELGDDTATLYAIRQNADGTETVYAAPQWWDAPAMLAAGFLKSNTADLLRYLEIYRTGGTAGAERILSPESVASMCRPHVPVSPRAGYGYGFSVTPGYHGATLVEHSGGLKGIAAQVSVVPERGVTGAALANVAGAPSGHVLLRAINGVLGLPLSARRAEYATVEPPAGSELAAYAGTYRSGEGARIAVSVEGQGLVFAAEGHRLPARPVGEDAFVATLREDETYARFLRRSGAVWAMAYGSRILRRAAGPEPAAD